MPAGDWEALCLWGVPSGAIRPGIRPSFGGAGRAPPPPEPAGVALQGLLAAGLAALDESQRECLRAWLRGFRHHWPERFEAVLGAIGTRALIDLERFSYDQNRYLKLRRIALANLALSF
jgi:hypothetical protein